MSHPSETINTKGHWAVGINWPVVGSTGNVYNVTMTNGGFDCNCPAFRKCKHIKQVEEGFDYEPETW
jgi:hypothetical protein